VAEKKKKTTRFKPQINYEEKQRRKGLVKVAAWVPITERENLLSIAEDMRKQAGLN